MRRQAAAEGSLSSGYSRSTIGPTGPSDTLWTIASRVRPNDSVSMQQVMLAIQDLNPDAFMGGNINRLKRGEVLRVPSLEDIQRRSRAEAVRQVARQNEAFEASRRTVDATATGRSAPAPTATTGGRPNSNCWSRTTRVAVMPRKAAPPAGTASFRGASMPALRW